MRRELDRRTLMAGLTAAVTTWPAVAAAQTPLAEVPDAGVVGKGQLQILAMPILDVTLYGPHGTYVETRPFALRVDYLTRLSGKGMARHAIDQMKADGLVTDQNRSDWQARLEALLPDVDKGDTFYAVRSSMHSAAFYRSTTLIGRLNDPGLADAFFAMCLGPHTSQPSLRRKLLSLS